MALMRQNNSASQSLSTISWRNGIIDSSDLESKIEEFWGLAANSIMKLNVHDLHPPCCLTRNEGPCDSLTVLAEAKAKRKQVFQLRCLSEDIVVW